MARNSVVSCIAWRWPALCGAGLLIGAVLAPNAAPAFTIEGGDTDQWNSKFNIEEQARQFSTPGAGSAAAGTPKIETPIGTMHFGVQRDAPGFGSPFGSSFNSNVRAADDRRHYDRMFTPIPRPEDGR